MRSGKLKFRSWGLALLVGLIVASASSRAAPPKPEEGEDSVKAVVKAGDEVAEIKIDESGIKVITESGEEYSAWVDKSQRIVIGKEGVIIGDLKIPEELKDFGFVIQEEEDGEDVVKVGRDIIIGEEEKVTGDVVALWGDVTVKGRVAGSVVAIDGDIYVTSSGYIRKGATSVGGEIKVEPGGRIHGEEVEVPLNIKFLGRSLRDPMVPLSTSRLVFAIITLVLFFIAITIVLSLMPRNVERIKLKIREEFLKSFLFGYLAFLGVIVLLIFLVITVIGIPIAILLPFFLLFMLALGLTAMCLFWGEKVKVPMNISTTSPFYIAFLGALAIQSLLIAGAILGLMPPLNSLAGLFTAAWVVIFFVLVTPASLGGVLLSRFGTRPSIKEQTLPEEPGPPAISSETEETSSGTTES
jgi:cytoskeletal protein CcmA (bactofilin family)